MLMDDGEGMMIVYRLVVNNNGVVSKATIGFSKASNGVYRTYGGVYKML